MKPMDEKEKIILKHYQKIIRDRKFDEYDILGFLIFIRRHLEKGKFPCILEFCDLIAHREREKGIAMEAITTAIKKGYEIEEGYKISGYEGIQKKKWSNEWEKLLGTLDIQFSESVLLEISLCIYSLAQDTQYNKTKISPDTAEEITYKGTVKLFQSICGNLNLFTTEGQSNSPFICFAQIGPYHYQKEFPSGYINEPVETFRDNGVLHLKTMSGEIII